MFGTLVDPFDEFFVQRRKKLNDDDNDEYDVVVEDKDSYSSDDYLVNYSLVPAHFSVSMVEKILFIGNSVAILKNSDSKLSVEKTYHKPQEFQPLMSIFLV